MAEPNPSSSQSKTIEEQIINDPIHGVIKLHPLLSKIINTPEFERLKDIKQLGVSYWIFPGASHNRFEHSIGTSYLCGKLIDNLRELHSHKKNGKIEITEEESLCVKVAGICHDLGHGPFSHFFDQNYKPGERVTPQLPDWKHEKASCELFDFMLEENQELRVEFQKYGLNEDEQIFIKDLILGKKLGEAEEKEKTAEEKTAEEKTAEEKTAEEKTAEEKTAEEKTAEEKTAEEKTAEEKTSSIVYEDGDDGQMYKKSFLYEIVNNKRNGIDCDKFDYFARDCHNVGVQSNFDCQRYFHTTRIMPIGDELQICVRDKEVFNLYELYHTRSSLHQRVYQHKTEAPIKDMLVEALSKVDEMFEISASILPEKRRRYTNLTDSIIHDICSSEANDEKTKDAQALLLRIKKRQLYKFCGEIYLPQDHPVVTMEKTEEEFKDEIIASIESINPATLSGEIFVSVAVIKPNKKGEDPIKKVNFFNKSGKLVKFPDEQLRQMGPAVWVKKIVRVYAKSLKSEVQDEVRKCFKEMCKEKGYHTVTEIDEDIGSLLPETPSKRKRSPSSSSGTKSKTCRNTMPTS